MSATILFLGQRMRPLESIEVVGAALGFKRSTAFKRAESWPIDGELHSRRVIVPALADQLGIPYEVCIEAKEDSHDA